MIRRWIRNGFRYPLWLGLTGLCLWCCPMAAHRSGTAPDVEYSGCWAVYTPGPVCSLYSGDKPLLKLWVETPPGTNVEILAGNRRLRGGGEKSIGGRRFKLPFPQRASVLTIRLRRSDDSLTPSWTLWLTASNEPVWLGEIEKLPLDEKLRRLKHLRKTAHQREQGLVLRSLALLTHDEQAYRDGIRANRATGCLSREVELTTRLASLYLDQGRFRAARGVLSSLRLPDGAPAEAKYWEGYYHGLLDKRVGNYREALEQLQQATDLAEKVGMQIFRRDTDQILAGLYQELGRSEEASRLLDRALDELGEIDDPCQQGTLLTNWAWSRLLAREGGAETEDPTVSLEQARILFEANDCARPDQRLNARINLALAHLQAGRSREARRFLDEAWHIKAQPTLPQRLWWDDLEARLEIMEGRPENALRLYEVLAERARRTRSLEGRFRALFGGANARLALSQREEAIRNLAAADRLLEEELWQIPFHEGRDTFLAQREGATRLHVQLLLDGGRVKEALNLVRRARSRLLRQLTTWDLLAQLSPGEQQRWSQSLERYRTLRDTMEKQAAKDWALAEDERRKELEARLDSALADLERELARLGQTQEGDLPSLHPDEVVLLYYPLPSGWVGFAAHGQEIETRKLKPLDLDADDPAALASILLDPFRSMIERAERVRVLPYGPLRKVDFHTLPFDGRESLLAGRRVVYGLDLPIPPVPVSRERTVLLVADPDGNLRAAREEADAVERAVDTWKAEWKVTALRSTEAGAEAVRKALPAADVLHYAGHGTYAGLGGWDSGLELADDSRLTPGDILALERVPSWIVLSSCETGRSSEEAPGEGLGLAHAFLLKGARGVIAATEPVEDGTSRDLMSALYRSWLPGKDLAAEFRRAQLECLQTHPDCKRFRLIEP